MIKLLGKKIVSTLVSDSRFKGQISRETFHQETSEYGKQLMLNFDDGTKLIVNIVHDEIGEPLLGINMVGNAPKRGCRHLNVISDGVVGSPVICQSCGHTVGHNVA